MNNEKKLYEIFKFAIANPEKAKELYPELVEGLEERILNWSPEVCANIIQNEPNLFLKRRKKANVLIGLRREKYIKERIKFLADLITIDYADEVEIYARESVKDEILEELKYWVGLNKESLKQVKKKFSLYCELGSLFAHGLITFESGNYIFDGVKYSESTNMANHLIDNKILTKGIKGVQQNLTSFASVNNLRGYHKNKTVYKNIFDYCIENNLEMTQEFESIKFD